MHKNSFGEFRAHLLECGVSPRQVRRIAAELQDHLEDLQCEARQSGLTADDARTEAERRLGDTRKIAERILEHDELRTWEYRFPRIARIYLPVAYALLLPATPVFAGVANPSLVARWGAALMLGGAVTASLLLGMQLAIVLN